MKTMILAAGRGKSGYLKDVPRVFQHMLVCCDQYTELHGFRKLLGRLYDLFADTRWFRSEGDDSGRRAWEKWLPKEAGYFCVRKMEIQCHFLRFMEDCRRKLSWFRHDFQYERGKRVKAMILAAGRGKSGHLKKPVISVGGEMLIERHIRKLAQTGYSEVIINVSYLADVIKQKVGYGERHGIRIIYSDEGNCSLNTGGGVKNALDKLGHSPFLLVSADVFTDWNFSTINLSTKCFRALVSGETQR